MPIRRPYRPPPAPERSLDRQDDEDDDPSISGEYRMIYGRTPRVVGRRGAIDAAPQSQGRMLDDELAFDLDDALDLDIPLLVDAAPRSSRSGAEHAPSSSSSATLAQVHHLAPRHEMPASSPSRQLALHAMHAGPPPSSRGSSPHHDPLRRSSGTLPAVHGALPPPDHVPDAHDRIVAFAGFGDAPTSAWSSPAYALHVMRRRRRLGEQLAIARLHGSPDVPIYEAALRTADEGAVRRGLVVAAGIAVLVIMTITALYEILHVALEVQP